MNKEKLETNEVEEKKEENKTEQKETNEEKQTKPGNTILKILRITTETIIWICIALLVFLIVMSTVSKKTDVLGRRLYVIMSGSMEPIFYRGDVVVVGRAVAAPCDVGTARSQRDAADDDIDGLARERFRVDIERLAVLPADRLCLYAVGDARRHAVRDALHIDRRREEDVVAVGEHDAVLEVA